MTWDIKSDRPIHTQLLNELEKRIVSGVYKQGDRLMSVRELAQEARVNPNTMQRALAELERMGLVYTVRTTGRYITEDEERIKQIKKEMALQHMKEFQKEMYALGFQKEEMLNMLKEFEA